MSKNKSIKSNESVDESKSSIPSSSNRREAVKNILAGSGLTIGAATSGTWIKPVVDAVILPTHAQTSAAAVLAGNVNLTTITHIDTKMHEGRSIDSDILGFFIGSANAGIPSGLDLAGACLILTIPGDGSFSLNIDFAFNPSIFFVGTVSGNTISGSGSGISISGTVDLAATPPTANGTVTSGSSTFGFAIDGSTTACTPISTTPPPTTAPPTTTTTTTTATPTTTTTTATPTTTITPM